MAKRQYSIGRLIFTQYLHSGLGLFFGLYGIYTALRDSALSTNQFTPVILIFTASTIIVCSFIGFISGYGLQERKCWAWYTTLLGQILYCLSGISAFLSIVQQYLAFAQGSTSVPGPSFVALFPLIIQMSLSTEILKSLFAVLQEYRQPRKTARRARYTSR